MSALAAVALAGLTWVKEPPRAFIAGELTIGAFAKAQAVAGYGQPRWSYFGVESWLLTTTEFAAHHIGLKAVIPFLEVTIGHRWTQSYLRSFLPVLPSYTVLPLDGARANYRSIDINCTAYVPVPTGFITLWGEVTHALDVPPEGRYYDEYLRVVTSGASAGSLRMAWVFDLARSKVLVGPMLERIAIAGRNVGYFRGGGVLAITLSRNLMINGIMTTPLGGPDHLGWWQGMWGTLALRYFYSTGPSNHGI